MIDADLWRNLPESYGRVARAWWDEYKDLFSEIAESELVELSKAMSGGDIYNAKVIAASSMTTEEWDAYRDGTTDKLRGVAQRRVRVREALDDLGRRTAKNIGSLILGHIK